jgi:hypothetical protein
MSILAIIFGIVGIAFLLAAYQWWPILHQRYSPNVENEWTPTWTLREGTDGHVTSRSVGWACLGIALGLMGPR